jgi:hypothetical protein
VLELVAFVAQIVARALAELGPHAPQVTRIEFDVWRSSEGDVFWRATGVQLSGDWLSAVCGVIERYDP